MFCLRPAITLCTATLLTASLNASTVALSQPQFDGHYDFGLRGQSFTAPVSTEMTGLRLSVSASFGGSDATVRLYGFNRSSLTFTTGILGSDTFHEVDLSPTPEWIDIPLDSPFLLEAGSTYAFTIEAKDPGGRATGWNNYAATETDVYNGGEFLVVLTLGRASTASNVKEYAFEVLTIPEPRTALLFSSMAVLTLVRRRRLEIADMRAR